MTEVIMTNGSYSESTTPTFTRRASVNRIFGWVLFCAVVCLAIGSRASGQNSMSATVVGTVADPTGAVVANATITLTNTATGVKTTRATNAQGAYYVPYMPPGNYTLSVDAKGFQKYSQTGVLLEVGAVPRFDVKLSVGSPTQVVEVNATSVPLLQTQNVDIGGLQTAKFIEDQPMMQSKPQYVMYYQLGSEYGGNNTFILAGLPGNFINYSIDGIGAKQSPRSAVGTVNNSAMPPVDAIQEARVSATGIPAEQGHDAGGAENMVIKSGTNALHWTAEERYINHDWIHKQVFQQAPLTTPFEYHNFDSTLGFPIYIPKIYDGRNKSFLFLGERFDYDHETNNQTASVVTPAMEGKDSTVSPGAHFDWPGAQPIYDPATITCTGGTGPACTGGTWSATQFPGNVIPLNRIDQVAKNFLALNPYRTPNQNLTSYVSTGPNQNLAAGNHYLADKEGYLARFDQVLGSKDRMYFHWIFNFYHTHPGRENIIYNPEVSYLLDPTGNSFSRPEPINTVNYVINETHVFSSSLVNEIHAGYMSRQDTVMPFTDNKNWAATLGIPGVPGSTFPAFISSGNSSVTWNADPGSFFRLLQDDFDFGDDMTKVIGHHVFKWGWQGLKARENDTGTASNSASTVPLPSGLYTFSGATTGFPFKPNTGNSFASFLLGASDYATYTEQLEGYYPRWWSNEFYFEDSWRTTSKLTLNLGIRYTLETSGSTKGGFKSQFNPGVVDPVSGDMGAITNPTGSIYPNAGSNFAPRIGVAYNFRPNWVFRGSFDLFTVDNMSEMGMDNYEATYAVAPPVGSPLPGMILSQGPGSIDYPINSNHTANFESATHNYSSRTATYLDPNLHNGHTMSYSAGVQWQFKPNTMVELDYIGSAAYGLINPYPVNINDLPQSIYTSGDQTLLNQVYSAQQKYLPYPQFGAINYYKNWDGSSFNSGIIDVQRRYSNGLSFDAHYTYEKIIDNGPGNQELTSTGASKYTVGTGSELNVTGPGPLAISYNKAATRAIDTGSFKNQFTGTVTWDIPVGRGRRFMNGGGIGDIFLGGWTFLSIQNLRSGSPVTFLQVGNPHKELPGQVFMSLVPGKPIKNPNFHLQHYNFPVTSQIPYYNISAFAYPTNAYTNGNSGIGASTTGGIWWPQWSLSKTVTVNEKYKLEVRMDADNLFPEVPYLTAMNTGANVTSPANFGKTANQSYGFSTYASPNGTLIGVVRLEF